MNKINKFFVLVSLLFSFQAVHAIEWDDKSPLWVGGGACPDKIKFSIFDKMSTYEKYEVEFRVSFEADEKNKHYISNKKSEGSNPIYVIFPDDFYDYKFESKTGQMMQPPSPCGSEKLFWSTYVNGRKISAGVIKNQITQFEVNGKLISTERK